MSENEAAQFYHWIKLKIDIHFSERIFYFYEREIWWASLGENVGREQNGKNQMFERPVLILKKFNKDMFLALPLTSKHKTGQLHFDLRPYGYRSTVIISQLRLISAKRLNRRIEVIDKRTFKIVKKLVVEMLE